MPNSIQINIEEFFGKNLYLPVGQPYGLENSTDAIYKLNTVSETISEMSRTIKQETVSSKKKYDIEDSKNAFLEEIEDKLEGMEENILYDELIDEENNLSAEIFDILVEKDNITKDDIVKLLESKNEYVLGFEDFDTNMKIEEDIKNIARLANDTYKIGKVNNLWKQKMNENKKVMSSQLDGVSRAISNVAKSIKSEEEGFEEEKKEIKILCAQKDIEILDVSIKRQDNGRVIVNTYEPFCKEDEKCKTEEIGKIISKVLKTKIVMQKEVCAKKLEQNLCRQVYISKDKFSIQVGIAHDKKNGSSVSGDYSSEMRLDDAKYLIALSDGMGSGPEARKSSKIAINMLNRMLSSRI